MRIGCACTEEHAAPRFVAVTGGPGAGKTAVLEVVQRTFCEHVTVLPEAAGMLFRGGFPRRSTDLARRAAQRAIYRVQVELERLAHDEHRAALVLCDRGTVDAEAYWTGPEGSFWGEVGSTREHELARYAAVIHLRTPSDEEGYERSNPLRIETAVEAAAIDARILAAWSAHPARTIIPCRPGFLDKLTAALEAIRRELPACCRAASALALACLVACSGPPDNGDEIPRQAAPEPRPSVGDADCAVDQDCELLPYINCCDECPPAPPFEAVPRREIDAVLIELETRCAADRRECEPPVCDPVPRGCYARASCVEGRCVVESEGCGS